jgi:hypothetical protein
MVGNGFAIIGVKFVVDQRMLIGDVGVAGIANAVAVEIVAVVIRIMVGQRSEATLLSVLSIAVETPPVVRIPFPMPAQKLCSAPAAPKS